MSRIGNKPIHLAAGITMSVKDGVVKVKGPKGELSTPTVPGVDIALEEGNIVITRQNEEKQTKAWHGMIRALVSNMVTGVSTGFQKNLEIVGVGYRGQMQGKKLVLNLGYSTGIEITMDGPTKLSVKGIDKQVVGQVAAIIRGFRSPEPYQGKGIRYVGERVIRKAGKTGTK